MKKETNEDSYKRKIYCMNTILTFLFLLIGIYGMISNVEAHIPVTYSCCHNYTDNDGVQLDNFENILSLNDPLDGVQLDSFENLSNWSVGGSLGAAQEADKVNFKEGYQGLKLIAKYGNVSTPSNWNRTYSDKVINNNFSNINNFGIWIYVDNVSNFYSGLLYFTSTTNWSKYFSQGITIKTPGWNRLIFNKSDFINTNGESWGNVMKKVRIAILPTTGHDINATFDDFRYGVSKSNWTVGVGGYQEPDTVNFKEGRQGLKLVTLNYTTSTDKAINNDFSSTNNFVLWAYVDNASNMQFITLYLTSTSNYSKFFSDSVYSGVKTGWNRLVFNKHKFTNTGGESWNNIMKYMRLRIYSFPNTFVNVTFDDLRYDMSGQRAKLMLEFDDGDNSTYTNVYPVLKNNSQSGVTFVITSAISNDSLYYMNMGNLKTLQNSGWDISSHTVNHVDLKTANDTTLTSELNDSYDWLVANNFQKSAGFIAYPYGSFNDRVIDNVKKRYILGRGTQPEPAQQHFTPTDDAIQYIQRTINVYNYTTVQSVKDQINDSINAKLLGIVLFHDVVQSYPICTADEPCTYQYLASDLKEISDYIKSRNSDLDVITYSDYVIPKINDFTPVLNKITRIFSNGSSEMVTNNKYDEYMPNMTVRPLSDSIDINITKYNETGGLINFNETSQNINQQVSYDIGDRIPNKIYNVKIYWENGTKYQDFNVSSSINGHITYNSVGFTNPRYQVIDKTDAIYVPLSIISYNPTSDPNTTFGIPQTFQISLNKTVNITWYINGSPIQSNSSMTRANYTNSSAGQGIYNVTAIAGDGFNSVSKIWNWTVIPIVQVRYNVSGHVFDNSGIALRDVSVRNNSYNNITDFGGYYMMTGLTNGTYNFSYSKPGFDINYLEVTVNGTDNNSVNMSIYDNTPPVQVTGLVNSTKAQTSVNLSWDSTSDANYYQIFRDSVSTGYTKNNYWNDTGLTPDTLYQYSVRANDSYNNWGLNSSVLSVKTDVQHYLLSIVSSLPSSDPTTTSGISQTFEINLNNTANIVWYVDGSLVQPNPSVTNATYTNSSAGEGIHNVTAVAEDDINSVSRIWNWTVDPIVQARYNISGYIFDNNDVGLEGVSVQDTGYTSNTDASGHYLIDGLLNGTYNFSYSKPGFDTSYLEVSINGADNNSANMSIYDNAPPVQISGLVNYMQTQTSVNLSWDSTSDANYYQIFRDSVSTGYTKNNYWNDTGLTPDTLYQYSVRANDSYNNWGLNSSVLSVKTDVQHYLLSIVSSLPSSDPTTTSGISQTFEINLNNTANIVWYINGTVVQTGTGLSTIYSNPAADAGVYNVTVVAQDGYDSVSRLWNWTVVPMAQQKYNLSGYVYNNSGYGIGDVLIQNNSNQNTTDSSGHYLISGLLNDTYNFSYSKTGFNTSYQNVTINGLDRSVNVVLSPVPVTRIITATIFPANTTPQSTIAINVSLSNNDGVIEMKADNILLTNNNGFWIGNKTAPSSIGNYTLNITARDSVGNNYQKSVSYTVLNRKGGASVSIIPRLNDVIAGNVVAPVIKVKNTQNIDDRFRVYISNDGIPVANQSNLGWFGWTEKFLDIRSGQETNIPIVISIPSGISGIKMFRTSLNSTTSTKVYTYDTGYLRIK